MRLDQIFQRFVDKSPISVMVRGMMERVLNPDQLDAWFERHACYQYTRELLFSTVFNLMSAVVCGSRKSIHAAYQATREEMAVSITSIYNKLNHMEVNTCRRLVQYAADEITAVIHMLGGTRERLLPGIRVKILDGNCIQSTEHRIKELRTVSAGALPGKSLVMLDPALRIPIDVFPCEDGHAQERSLILDVLATVAASDCVIADRNFCTIDFLQGVDGRDAYVVIRRHQQVSCGAMGPMTSPQPMDTGMVSEQAVMIGHEPSSATAFRLVRVALNQPTREGEAEIDIITNLPESLADAATVAQLYRKRWTIETAFQDLARDLNSEINTLGYPRAALFGFSIALVVYMMYAVVKAALSHVHGSDTVDNELSGYYLADEISATYRGMMIAIEDSAWVVFRTCSMEEFVATLIMLATKVKMAAYRKHPRGPKKKAPKRLFDPRHPHVATARLIAARKKAS